MHNVKHISLQIVPMLQSAKFGIYYAAKKTNKYSLRSEVVDHTLCNSDQNVCWTRIIFLIIASATPHLNLMEWPCLCQLCWIRHLSHPIGLTSSLTQHKGQGLHHSIVHEKFGQQCALNSLQTSCMRYYTFVSVQERKWQETFQAQH